LKTRVVVVGSSELLRARTMRSLARFGATAEPSEDLSSALEVDEPTWFLRAGAWAFDVPDVHPSATGKPLLAFGAIRGDRAWEETLARTGGILDGATTPRVASVLVETPARLRDIESLDDVHALARSGAFRAVRLHAADVGFDERVRACVAVTALRRGGAERVAIDTTNALRASGVAVLFAVTGPRIPDGYEAPEGTLFIRDITKRHAEIGPSLARAASDFGADVVHAHLFDAADLRELAVHVPVVTTVHNDRARFPEGFGAITDDACALTLACSWRTRDALVESNVPRVRVAPNGVDRSRLAGGDRASTRRMLEAGDAVVILCVANPRRQKRLELAVEALAVVRRTREAILVIAGDPVEEEASKTIDDTIARTNMAPFVRRVGAREDVASLFAAADVFLTTSLYEGMSVAQLEALASGVPVVTTDVGGARELSRTHDGYAIADANADALAHALAIAPAKRPSLSPAFESPALAKRHERAYRAAAVHGTDREGLVLVINNFSTGGAQASARRLLGSLHARGHRVAAAVLQEQSRFPTAWRADLEKRLPVFVAPGRGADADASARAVAAFVAKRRARTVVFWNAMTAHKLLLADELAGVRLFDVSPGEMYFSALERYFESPRADLPYFDSRDYGSLLDGAVVKFEAEAERARRVLGAPVHVIANGVALPEIIKRESNGTFVIGTLARISPDKKLEELLEAARHLPSHCKIQIAGRVERGCDAYAEDLRERSRDLPIAFVGEVDSASFLPSLDAFAMVSEPEGCPNALLEAMAARLPVAATNAGGASEMITDGDTGLLVPRGDGQSLGRALARITDDASLREKISAGARERIRDRFDVRRMTDDYEALFFG
jgi:glycosyltransferase involved in cell wall biosynthesis